MTPDPEATKSSADRQPTEQSALEVGPKSPATIMAETALESLLKIEPEIAAQGKDDVMVYRTFLEGISAELSKYWEQPVTLRTLLQAQTEALRYIKESGFFYHVANSLMQGEKSTAAGFAINQLKSQMDEMLDLMIEDASKKIKATPLELRRKGISERAYMLSKSVGLNEETRELYTRGALTMGELFVMQPNKIVEYLKVGKDLLGPG